MKLLSFFNKRKKLTRILCICLASALLITSGVFFYLYETSEIIDENINIKKTKASEEKIAQEVEKESASEDDTYSYDYDYGSFDVTYSDETEDHSVKKSFVPSVYKLVWGDDFEGNTINKSKWQITENTLKDTLWANDSDVLNVKNGLLNLTTMHFFDPYDSLIQYKLPAEISTMKTMNFRYGYLEMCARVPFKTGAWPSFWLKGTNGPAGYKELVKDDYKCTAYSSEIDIFENFASCDTIAPNLHKWYAGGANANTSDKLKDSDEVCEYRFSYLGKLSDEYHVYGFEWTDKNISLYVDGEKYYTFDITEKGNFDDDTHKTDMSGFHDPHYILIWNNIYTPLTQTNNLVNPSDLPLHYDIDWIHLYQKPNLGTIYTKGSK